jgi:hypothetical protein
MLRALVLVPLLAAGMDQARASWLCGPDGHSCLDAAGHGGLGVVGVLVMVGYALGSAFLVGRLARRQRAPLSLWAVGTAGVWASCGGQALLAHALGGSALGGGWIALLVLGLAAGALLALVLRVALPAARRLIWSLRPSSPVARLRPVSARRAPVSTLGAPRIAFSRLGRDRAPPFVA